MSRQLQEYRIVLNFYVEAHDEQELREIARDLVNRAKDGSPWRILGEEIDKLEEV